MAVVMNGELIYTHTLPCELMADSSVQQSSQGPELLELLFRGELPTGASGHLPWRPSLGVRQVHHCISVGLLAAENRLTAHRRALATSLEVYQLMLVGGRAMEPQHAKEVQAQDELKAFCPSLPE